MAKRTSRPTTPYSHHNRTARTPHGQKNKGFSRITHFNRPRPLPADPRLDTPFPTERFPPLAPRRGGFEEAVVPTGVTKRLAPEDEPVGRAALAVELEETPLAAVLGTGDTTLGREAPDGRVRVFPVEEEEWRVSAETLEETDEELLEPPPLLRLVGELEERRPGLRDICPFEGLEPSLTEDNRVPGLRRSWEDPLRVSTDRREAPGGAAPPLPVLPELPLFVIGARPDRPPPPTLPDPAGGRAPRSTRLPTPPTKHGRGGQG